MTMENIKEIERGRENGWRLGFHVVQHSAYVHIFINILCVIFLNNYNVL
jgi:hypothetical protein